MSEIQTIFKYGGFGEDIEIIKESTNIKGLPFRYYIGIEGFIWYPSLQEGINYYKKIKDKYLEFLKENYKELDLKTKNISESDLVYRSYDIEINKDEHGWTIYVSAPTFYELKDTYVWLNGVIEQLDNIKGNLESEEE